MSQRNKLMLLDNSNKMKKTLKNIIACSLIGGSLLFAGCGKHEKYVLVSPRAKANAGEYDTREQAIKQGLYMFGNSPFEVKEKEEFLREERLESERKSQQVIQPSTLSQDELLKNLPGHAFKENVFANIDRQRYFDKRDYRRYVIGIEEGITFYDLDKDGYLDIGAKFEGISTFAKMVSIYTNRDILPDPMYTDLNNDGILERKTFINSETIGPNGKSGRVLWHEDLKK